MQMSLESKVEKMEAVMDKILIAVVSIQEDQKTIKQDLNIVKQQVDLLYNRVDQFLRMVDRHESEIAALRSAYQRLEQRIVALERMTS